MVFSPSISAAVITGINYGKQGLKELFSGFIRVKVSWIWYLAATILLFGPFIVIVLINYFSRASIFRFKPSRLNFFVFFIYNLFSGPASEELGWRFRTAAYAEKNSLPSLQRFYRVLFGSFGTYHLCLYPIHLKQLHSGLYI